MGYRNSTKYTAEQVQGYLSDTFLTLDGLAERSGLTARRLLELIYAGCIPGPSYFVSARGKISTYLHGDSALDAGAPELYFSPATLEWIKRSASLANGGGDRETARRMQALFETEFSRALAEIDAERLAFPECFAKDGTLDKSKFGEVARDKWTHVLKGTYGICVREPLSAADVVRKAVAVMRIAKLTDEGRKPNLNAREREALLAALKDFDAIVSEFAPHDRPTSSRKRYFDDIVSKHAFESHFKKTEYRSLETREPALAAA
ncbi:MAG: hypothetical protein HY078_03290 [Elusimicrobia bacterium]|nr:hypothetical protein [Elusimicrobiota bacterium]